MSDPYHTTYLQLYEGILLNIVARDKIHIMAC